MTYVSTPQDRRTAIALGAIYVFLAIVLAYMLFVIWPPVPWPNSEKVGASSAARAELEREAALCGCIAPPKDATKTANSHDSNSASAQPNHPSMVQAGNNPAGQQANSQPTTSPSQANGQPGTTPTPQGDAQSPRPSETSTPPVSDDKNKDSQGNPLVLPLRLPLKILRYCICTTFDERLLLLVIVAGMLGAFVHGATSLADFIGNNSFNKNWAWFYLLRPVIGMALALVFYFVIRGGFLTTSGGAGDINPYGIAALAGLVGMFSKQATDKLSEVFSTLFKSSEGGDKLRTGSLEGDKTVTVSKVDPPQIIAVTGSPTITLTGTNFVSGATVQANGTVLETTFVSETQLTAQLTRELIANPVTLKLKVVNPDANESKPIDLPVVASN